MLMFTVRLIGGPNIREGRLEVLQRDTWGSVCNITLAAAKVICSSLGFGYALYAQCYCYCFAIKQLIASFSFFISSSGNRNNNNNK